MTLCIEGCVSIEQTLLFNNLALKHFPKIFHNSLKMLQILIRRFSNLFKIFSNLFNIFPKFLWSIRFTRPPKISVIFSEVSRSNFFYLPSATASRKKFKSCWKFFVPSFRKFKKCYNNDFRFSQIFQERFPESKYSCNLSKISSKFEKFSAVSFVFARYFIEIFLQNSG